MQKKKKNFSWGKIKSSDSYKGLVREALKMWTGSPVSTAPLAFPGRSVHKTGLVVHLSQELVGPPGLGACVELAGAGGLVGSGGRLLTLGVLMLEPDTPSLGLAPWGPGANPALQAWRTENWLGMPLSPRPCWRLSATQESLRFRQNCLSSLNPQVVSVRTQWPGSLGGKLGF